MNLDNPFFYRIGYVLGDNSLHPGASDLSSVTVDIDWIDRFTGARRGDVNRLSKSSPYINGFLIPFPTKEWRDKKPKTLSIGNHTYNIVDHWDGYEYICKEIKNLELITHKLPRGLLHE